jgi:lipopolysaccharide transport system ATP-binding protein
MSRREIARKFDRIVDFAEIEEFLDTPVKRYSSGMYVRLAYAVAAHMEPEILLVDEVLAVGDLKFQRKCLEHAKSLRDRCATVILVSHNMFAIKSVCRRAICVSHGRLVIDGPVDDAIALYEKDSRLMTPRWAEDGIFKQDSQSLIKATDITILDENGAPRTVFEHGERMRIRIRLEATRPLHRPNLIVALIRSDNVACCNFNTAMDGTTISRLSGESEVELLTPPLRLVSETYAIHFLVRDDSFQRLYCAQAGPSFQVRHELLSTHFGVYHERGEWSIPGETRVRRPDGDRCASLSFIQPATADVVGDGSQPE